MFMGFLQTLWADDLREQFRTEKQVLEDKVASLEAKLASATPASGTGLSGTLATTSSSTMSSASTTSSAATTASSVTSAGSSTACAPSTAVTGSSSSSSTATSSGSSTSTCTTDSTTTVMSIGSAEMIKRLFETQSQMFAAQMHCVRLMARVMEMTTSLTCG